MNAKKSTGPTSPEGRARSALNAMKHALLAERVLLVEDGEVDDFCMLFFELRRDLDPIGRLEEELVDRVISLTWRLGRAAKIERGLLMLTRGNADLLPAARLAIGFRRDARDANALDRISGYEVRLERSLFRCLHEVERRQRARQGQRVPPPAVVDLHLHGDDA